MKARILLTSGLVVGLVLFIVFTVAAQEQANVIPSGTYTTYLPKVMKASGPCSTIPSLLAPANGTALNTLIPVFRWDAGDCSYATNVFIELSSDATFSGVFFRLRYSPAHGEGHFQYMDNLNPATTYYWRARLECGPAQGPFTEAWSFTTGSGGVILPPPTLVAPANGAVLTSLPVTFQWLPVDGAVGYQVTWRKASAPNVQYSSLVTETQLTTDWNIDPANTYEWYVVARNDYAMGNRSEVWRFTAPAGSSALSHVDTKCPMWTKFKDNNKVIFVRSKDAH